MDSDRISPITIVAFTKLNGIIVPDCEDKIEHNRHDTLLACFIHELLNYGYIVTNELYIALDELDSELLIKLYKDVFIIAGESVGANVIHEPLYPNFPAQVTNAPGIELILNALTHYWSDGALRPLYRKVPRLKLDEDHPLTTISVVSIDDVKEYLFKVLSSKSSIPQSLLDFVDCAIDLGWVNEFEGQIPFRETLCRVATAMVRNGQSIDSIVSVTTDILRIMAHLSNSDIELKERKIKFKSLPRKQRRIIISALERVISVDDVKLHPDLWKHAFHCLHVGEYGGKSHSIATRFRNTRNVPTTDTIIAEAIKVGNVRQAVEHLIHKPSVLARNLDKLLRDCQTEQEVDYILANFTKVSSSINSKVLLQLLGHFQSRSDDSITTRVVFTAGSKGSNLSAPLLQVLPPLHTNRVVSILTSALLSTFKAKQLLVNKTIFISPQTTKILLPLQLASINDSKKCVARGSRIPLVETPSDASKSIIRLFVHWIGHDVDLSAFFLNSDLTNSQHISFQQLRTGFAVHSGDVIQAPAPNGASEFVDVDIDKTLDAGYRYVAMDLRVYSGQKFGSLEQCFAGFMFREEMQSGEIFEPSTVRLKFDVISNTTSVVSCLFDLQSRELIWIDAPIKLGRLDEKPNSLTLNTASVREILESYLEIHKCKPTISQLVQLHAESGSSTVTTNKDEADFTVGLDIDDDLNVYDFVTINSVWI